MAAQHDLLVGGHLVRNLNPMHWQVVLQEKGRGEMLIATWHGKTVEVKNENNQLIRRINAFRNVVGVQCSGNNIDDGMVNVQEEGGHFELFKANGSLQRRG